MKPIHNNPVLNIQLISSVNTMSKIQNETNSQHFLSDLRSFASVNTMSKIQNETNSQHYMDVDVTLRECEYYVKDTK